MSALSSRFWAGGRCRAPSPHKTKKGLSEYLSHYALEPRELKHLVTFTYFSNNRGDERAVYKDERRVARSGGRLGLADTDVGADATCMYIVTLLPLSTMKTYSCHQIGTICFKRKTRYQRVPMGNMNENDKPRGGRIASIHLVQFYISTESKKHAKMINKATANPSSSS